MPGRKVSEWVGVKSRLKSKSLSPSRQTKESVPEAGVVVVMVAGVVLLTMLSRLAKFPNVLVVNRE